MPHVSWPNHPPTSKFLDLPLNAQQTSSDTCVYENVSEASKGKLVVYSALDSVLIVFYYHSHSSIQGDMYLYSVSALLMKLQSSKFLSLQIQLQTVSSYLDGWDIL